MADRLPPPDNGHDPGADRGNGDRTSWWRTTRLAGRLFPGSTLPTGDRAATASGRNPVEEPPEFDFDDPDQCEFGGYQLRALLGGGGAGWIYRAHQRSLDRDVALKLLSGGIWAAPEGVDRLRHEAQDAARLKHPNIVTVYEVGEQHGRIYYAMELVEGRNLGQCIRQQGPLPPREAASLVRVLAEAVDYAHRLGVLHLDLNPANVLLGTDGVAKIADFGLARRVADGDSVPTERISGTPGYIAPEQVQLHLGRLCAATDVWGLGAVLYEALTGHAPFEGSSARSTIELALRGRVRDPRRYRRDLPRDLQAICLHCLRRQPIARYASARGLADDLGRYLEGREVHVRPLNPLQRFAHFARREPLLALTAALLIVGLIVGLSVTIWLWQSAKANAVMAQEVNRFLNEDVLGAADPYRFEPPDVSQPRQMMQDLLAHAEVKLDQGGISQPEARAQVALTIGRVYFGLGLWDKASKRLKRAHDYTRTTLGESAPLTLDIEQQLALTEIFNSHYAEATDIYRHLLQARRKYPGWDKPVTIKARRGHVQLLYESGLIEQALHELEDARRDAQSNAPGQLAAIDWKLSDLYAETNRWSEAETLVRSALATSRRQLGPTHPQHLWQRVSLGDILLMRAKWDEAEALFQDLHATFTGTLGPNHPMTLTAAHYLGQLSLAGGDLDSALPQLERTLERRTEVHGARHKWTQYTLNRLGQALIEAGRPTEAIALLDGALADITRAGRRQQSYVLLILDNLARAHLHNNEPEQAEIYLDEALATAERRLPPNNFRVGLLRRTQGELFERQGNVEQAIAAYAIAERIFSEGFGNAHPDVRQLRSKIQTLEAI